MAKVEFRQDRRSKLGGEPQWTVLEIAKAQTPDEALGDNIQLKLPQNEGTLGVRDDGTPNPQKNFVRFLCVDE